MLFVFRLFCFLLIGIFSCSASTLSINTFLAPSLEDVLEDVYSSSTNNNNVKTLEDKDSLVSPETTEKNIPIKTHATSQNATNTPSKEDNILDNTSKAEKNKPLELVKEVQQRETVILEQKNDAVKHSTSTQEIFRKETQATTKDSEIVLDDLRDLHDTKKCVIPAEIPDSIRNDFERAIKDIPCELLQSLRTIEIFEDPEGVFPRAMANGRILKIRSDTIYQPEFVQVLIHELGHVVDLGGLRSNTFSKKSSYKDGNTIIYADDLSVLFYKISWETEFQKKREMTRLDFVGGYAAQNMFEDYSESFLMYIEHGNTFQMLASKNPVLQKKYNFFRDYVFGGEEFFTGSYKIDHEKRLWDITKM